ncbi:hypothetical protein NE237_014656 [Protea cynaroides]|uniref:Uncharacterized protein n=1 Tax=Protea cynaroides TaxID=273540 RepID=A0A9Q0KCJ3_9MAGN|nr:hypothetical protein NE237_014656 [Protea cynaroides]
MSCPRFRWREENLDLRPGRETGYKKVGGGLRRSSEVQTLSGGTWDVASDQVMVEIKGLVESTKVVANQISVSRRPTTIGEGGCLWVGGSSSAAGELQEISWVPSLLMVFSSRRFFEGVVKSCRCI